MDFYRKGYFYDATIAMDYVIIVMGWNGDGTEGRQDDEMMGEVEEAEGEREEIHRMANGTVWGAVKVVQLSKMYDFIQKHVKGVVGWLHIYNYHWQCLQTILKTSHLSQHHHIFIPRHSSRHSCSSPPHIPCFTHLCLCFPSYINRHNIFTQHYLQYSHTWSPCPL